MMFCFLQYLKHVSMIACIYGSCAILLQMKFYIEIQGLLIYCQTDNIRYGTTSGSLDCAAV